MAFPFFFVIHLPESKFNHPCKRSSSSCRSLAGFDLMAHSTAGNLLHIKRLQDTYGGKECSLLIHRFCPHALHPQANSESDPRKTVSGGILIFSLCFKEIPAKRPETAFRALGNASATDLPPMSDEIKVE